jgi:phenylalanyl-tRNA synthetase beta chain
MPTISVSKIDLESLLDKRLSMDELETSLQLVKGELKEAVDDELRIELGDTNRPDLLSVEGIARQIKRSHADSAEMFRNKESSREAESLRILVDSELEHIRPYVGGFVAKGFTLTEAALLAAIQTQEKLCEGFGHRRKSIAIGIYDAQKIKFPVFYKAVLPAEKKFVPLGFEEELSLQEILDTHPKGQEYGYILHKMPKFPFLEDSKGVALSFPPVVNSRLTGEVKPGDTDVFCEVTGTDVEQLLLIMNVLAANFRDRGAEIYPCTVEYSYSTQLGTTVITPCDPGNDLTIKLREFETVLGKAFAPTEIKENLESMGYKVHVGDQRGAKATDNSDDQLNITVPYYRRDVMHAVDVIEDLAISVGYDSFEPAPLEEFTLGRPSPMQSVLDRVRGIMVGCGFEETISNVLMSKDILFGNMRASLPNEISEGKSGSEGGEATNSAIEVENPVSDSYAILRNSIIPSLLSLETQSSKAAYPHRVFEVSEVVVPSSEADLKSRTESRLAALISHPGANFSELHSSLDNLAYYLGFSYKLEKIEHPSFIKGRVGSIILESVRGVSVDKKAPIGIMGEIHPEVLENFKIKCPVTVFELVPPRDLVIG